MTLAIAIMISVAMVVIAIRSVVRSRDRNRFIEQRLEAERLRREMERLNERDK